MEMQMNSRTPSIVACVALIIIALGAFGWHEYATASAAAGIPQASACVPNNPSEVCPSQEFLNLYAQAKSLQAEVTKDKQSDEAKKIEQKQYLLTGIAYTLNNMAPKTPIGQPYTYNDSLRKFIAPEPPKMPSPAPVPVPAPPRKK
jgi:hypothetical protein